MIHDVIFHLGKCIFKLYSLRRTIIEWDQFTMRNISVEKKKCKIYTFGGDWKIDPQFHFEFFMWVWVLQCWTSSKSLGNCKNNGLMATHHNCNIGRLKVLTLGDFLLNDIAFHWLSNPCVNPVFLTIYHEGINCKISTYVRKGQTWKK